MGTIFYGSCATPIHVEDRALAHLKVLIATKLRRGESFTLSWPHPEGQPSARSTIWLSPAVELRFVFDHPEPPEIDRSHLANLARTAYSAGGIQLTSEDVAPSAATPPAEDRRGRTPDFPHGSASGRPRPVRTEMR